MSVFFINPFLGAVGGDFESIATVTVGSGGAANIEFTSIPGGFQHLQIRALIKNNGIAQTLIRMNSDTGSNYTEHQLSGNGASASAYGAGNGSAMYFLSSGSSQTYFCANVFDILDYASTSKNKTVRAFGGHDQNGSGEVRLDSGLWRSTSAITTVALTPQSGSFVQYTTAALYGIKAP